jgi:hypothetical protein
MSTASDEQLGNGKGYNRTDLLSSQHIVAIEIRCFRGILFQVIPLYAAASTHSIQGRTLNDGGPTGVDWRESY